jgi:hypothetical protein
MDKPKLFSLDDNRPDDVVGRCGTDEITPNKLGGNSGSGRCEKCISIGAELVPGPPVFLIQGKSEARTFCRVFGDTAARRCESVEVSHECA